MHEVAGNLADVIIVTVDSAFANLVEVGIKE